MQIPCTMNHEARTMSENEAETKLRANRKRVTTKHSDIFVSVPTFQLALMADRRVRFIDHCERMSLQDLKHTYEKELEMIDAELAKRE